MLFGKKKYSIGEIYNAFQLKVVSSQTNRFENILIKFTTSTTEIFQLKSLIKENGGNLYSEKKDPAEFKLYIFSL